MERGRITRPVRLTGWRRWMPSAALLARYERPWFLHDLVAGLTLTTMLLPVGIAYAVASGVPGICGLYASILALLAYAVFGPSRIFVLGPDSSLAALVLAVVLPLSGGDPQRAMAVAGMLALSSGGLCVLAGIAHLGFVTELLSKPIRYGYTNGIALTVLIGQIPTLCGFSVKADTLWGKTHEIAEAVLAGKINTTALCLGGTTLVAILLLRRWRCLPGVLIAVTGATVASALLGLGTRHGVVVLGVLPQGLPKLVFPLVHATDWQPILLGSLAIALVAFADTNILSRTYAQRTGAAVDPNQEMVALGAANIATGLFQGFPISSSASRTPVAEAAGARTQLTGIVGAVAIGVLLVAAPNLLTHLPRAALAAVVIASALSLIEVSDLRRIWRIQRWEFWLSIGCLVGVAALGAITGIGLAIGIAVVEFLWDGWRPHHAVLGRVDGIKGYHDITRYPEARQVPGLVLFRWDAPLFFANAELFRDRALEAAADAPTPVNWLVICAEPVTSVDVTAADALVELDQLLTEAGITLCFAEVKDPVKDKLKRFGLFTQWGEERFFATLGQAVSRYRKTHPVDWIDWEERNTDETQMSG